MKIVDVKAYPIMHIPKRPLANSTDWNQKRSVVLVKVTSDEGITGWGEAYGMPQGIAKIIETHFKDKLVGADPFRVQYHWFSAQVKKGLPAGALGGVDIALWDLKAKALNVPLYELLGGKIADTFSPYASGYPYKEDNPESLEQFDLDIDESINKGFKAVKIKIGFGKAVDMRRISRIKERFGDDVDIMVDVNQGYNVRTCLELLPFLEEYKVKWLEEPLPWHSFAGYQELRKRSSIPIAAGEAEQSMQGFIEAIRNGVVDIIQPDVPLCGGITAAKRIAAFAYEHQVEVHPHIFQSVFALPASLHLLASLPDNKSWQVMPTPMLLEWDVNTNPMALKILKNPIKIENGVVKVPTGVGLGVEVNEEAIEEFLIK
jgi:D-galactarolactone cycloisomerase